MKIRGWINCRIEDFEKNVFNLVIIYGHDLDNPEMHVDGEDLVNSGGIVDE